MAEAFLRLDAKDRLDALGVAADRLGRPAHLLEKDVWVVWAIQQLFGSPIGTNLVFKGGTSLSKAYQVIDRFSEALLHKSAEGRSSPFPGRTYPVTSVMGVPSAVKPLRTATRTWNSAT